MKRCEQVADIGVIEPQSFEVLTRLGDEFDAAEVVTVVVGEVGWALGFWPRIRSAPLWVVWIVIRTPLRNRLV